MSRAAVPAPRARTQGAPRGRVAEPLPRRASPQRARGLRRLFGVLLALLAIIAVVVVLAVVLSTSTSKSVVHLRQVAGQDLNSVVNQFQQLIGSNTSH